MSVSMGRLRSLVFPLAVALWGIVVTAIVLYIFFPYQKVIKIALQSAVGGGRVTIAMEGVKTRALGIRAAKLSLRPDVNGLQTIPFELSQVDIAWSLFSLLKGKLDIDSKASFCDGLVKSTIDGIPLMRPSSSSILLTLKDINLAKWPKGVFPWLGDMTGTLDGVFKKEMSPATSNKQIGAFQFVIRNGEIRDIRVKNLPRLIVPYKQITMEGKLSGSRIDVTRIFLASDIILLHGNGSIDPWDPEQNIEVNLYYEALSKALPLKGKGTISIRGNQTAPLVTISDGTAEKREIMKGAPG
jgi:type II secretion system protein N